MSGHWREEQAKAKVEAKAAYDKNPTLCAREGCDQPVPYGRFTKGGKYCCQYCSILVRAQENSGRANPHNMRGPFATANWNGKIKKLNQ